MSDYSKSLRKTSNVNSAVLLVWLAFVFIAGYFSNTVVSLFVNENSENFTYIRDLSAFLFQYIVAVPVPVLIFSRFNHKPKLKSVFTKPQMPASWIVKWIFITLFLTNLVNYAATFFFAIVQAITGTELHAVDMAADSNIWSKITNIVAMLILAPLFEEIMFRGQILKNSEKHGSWAVVISMGIMFGLMHSNYAQTFYTAVFGICAGFMAVKSKSIIPSILLHISLNLIGCISSLFVGNVDSERLSSGDMQYILDNLLSIGVVAFMGLITMAISFVGMILLILEIVNHKDSFKLENDNPEVSEKKKVLIYFTSPVTIIVSVIFIALTVINALFI